MPPAACHVRARLAIVVPRFADLAQLRPGYLPDRIGQLALPFVRGVQVDQRGPLAVMAHPDHQFPGVRARVGGELVAGMTRVVNVDARQAGSGGHSVILSIMDKANDQNNKSVKDYMASLADEKTVIDSRVLIEMMQRISGHEPKLWNVGTLGFDGYHYKYDSGREGDSFVIGFYPRKGKITVYLMDGTARYSELLAKLGKHTITGYCIYIKQLSNVELPILEQIVRQSYEYIKSLSKDGPISRILWRAEK